MILTNNFYLDEKKSKYFFIHPNVIFKDMKSMKINNGFINKIFIPYSYHNLARSVNTSFLKEDDKLYIDNFRKKNYISIDTLIKIINLTDRLMLFTGLEKDFSYNSNSLIDGVLQVHTFSLTNSSAYSCHYKTSMILSTLIEEIQSDKYKTFRMDDSFIEYLKEECTKLNGVDLPDVLINKLKSHIKSQKIEKYLTPITINDIIGVI